MLSEAQQKHVLELVKETRSLIYREMGKEKVLEYLNRYFDNVIYMLENCDYDIAAHITCPLRYINGKYGARIFIIFPTSLLL